LALVFFRSQREFDEPVRISAGGFSLPVKPEPDVLRLA
jgi:hypothetical protein